MSIKTTDRDIEKLSDNFRLKVKLFLKEVWDIIFITEGYRSQARQEYLYSLWRTRPWNKVTWTLNSEHTKWNAIDIAFKWDNLYPNEIEKWQEISQVSKKYWIDWGYDLWKTDKPHFQDNWKPYISKDKDMIPNEFHWLKVKQVDFDRVWLMKLKWVNTEEEDHIVVNPTIASKWEARVNKVLLHEFSHFIYHRYIKDKVFEKIDNTDLELTQYEYWDYISKNLKHYITDYASTHTAEDFAELIWYSYYIENNIPFPDKVTWNDDIKFKYIIANNIYKQGLKKYGK